MPRAATNRAARIGPRDSQHVCACVAPPRSVDDLEEIGDLEGYIDRTSMILVYCSKGYFKSRNCMIELVASTRKAKPIIALIDPDKSRGGMTTTEVHTELLEAEDLYSKWEFDPSTTPNGQALYDHLFAHAPIEWHRIGVQSNATPSPFVCESFYLDADTLRALRGSQATFRT